MSGPAGVPEAVSLRGIVDNLSSTVISVLLLVALMVLGYGLVRAIRGRRRFQIVMTDLTVPAGYRDLAQVVLLSPVARQQVERQVSGQREETARVIRTIMADAAPGLAPQVLSGIVDHVQRVADDSVATLVAALRAVSPDTADRFAGLFAAVLPPPRGLSVSMAVLRRGSLAAPRLGLAIEVVRLDGRPLTATMFWEPLGARTGADPGDGSVERLLPLVEPAARWIAVRLVVDLQTTLRPPPGAPARPGVQRLLAGGLFLSAMRDFPEHALAFGEQAVDDLAQARTLLPGLPLPVTTLAGVHDRMARASQDAADEPGAQAGFRRAVRLWQEAEELTRAQAGAGTGAGSEAEAALVRLADRRLKTQLACDDSALRAAALTELTGLAKVPGPEVLLGNPVWLYNRSCLYAAASAIDPEADYQREALYWLGLALVRDREALLWEHALTDPDLAPVRSGLPVFLDRLHDVTPAEPPASQAAAALVTQALSWAGA